MMTKLLFLTFFVASAIAQASVERCCCIWQGAGDRCLPGFPTASCTEHGWSCRDASTTTAATHATTTHTTTTHTTTTHAPAGDSCVAVHAPRSGTNVCDATTIAIPNLQCVVDGVVNALAQAGTDVTVGYHGELATDVHPITAPFYTKGLCPVNVHYHLGAEHRSLGEFDEAGKGPTGSVEHHKREEAPRLGLRCHHYDDHDEKFTKAFEWKHCAGIQVGETYEVHWPHSIAGDCASINQYQTPFADGVFCHSAKLDLTNLQNEVGVQAQVFTVVNDEAFYYPDMIRGMIVDSSHGMGQEITKYTGSTTGTSRDNELCSGYSPITWQVDRKCHLISASSFDKMCADMQMQRDDMSADLHPHGARELVTDQLAADNHENRKKETSETLYGNFVY